MKPNEIKTKRDVKAWRLTLEIATLKTFVSDGKLALKHNPYKEDHPAQKRELEIAEYALALAERELAIWNARTELKKIGYR